MEQKIYGTGAPHLKGRMTTQKIMQCIILALLPAGIHGIYRYGWNAGLIILLTCGSAVVTEYLFEKIMKKPIRVGELRVLVTGLIMSYALPPGISWYVAVLAGVLCALIMQSSLHFFSKNVVSPVILTRLFLMVAFSREMFTYALDGVTMATPLDALKAEEVVDTLDMIFGNTGGCIGETSAVLLCAGAIFLIMMGIMDFRVAGMYMFSFAAFMAVFGGNCSEVIKNRKMDNFSLPVGVNSAMIKKILTRGDHNDPYPATGGSHLPDHRPWRYGDLPRCEGSL